MSNILYGAFASPFVRKTRLVLAAKGIEHTVKQTSPHAKDEDFRACSPLGKIPGWSDDQIKIADSSVIIMYLEKRYPENSVLPSNNADYARALWFEEYADSKMVTAMGAHLQAERIMAKVFFGREPIQADIDKAINKEIPEISAYLESQLQDSDYLVGNDLTLADLAVGASLQMLYHCGETIDANQYPKLAAYTQRLFAMDSFTALRQEEIILYKKAFNWDSPLTA